MHAFGWDGEEKTFEVGVRADTAIVPNWWTHLLATVEPGTAARLYINGELRGEETDGEINGFKEKFDEYLGVGWNPEGVIRGDNDPRFQGDMSDLRLYLGPSAELEDSKRIYENTKHGSEQHGTVHPKDWDVDVEITPNELAIGSSQDVKVVVKYNSPRELHDSRVHNAEIYMDEAVGSYTGVVDGNEPDTYTNSFGEATVPVEDLHEDAEIAVVNPHSV